MLKVKPLVVITNGFFVTVLRDKLNIFMGDLSLKRDSRFKQGLYIPLNKEKYVGKIPFVYRSGLELEYFRMLDRNPNVIKWGSEEVVIPYYFQGAAHKYYVDLFVIFKNGDAIKKYFIEIKPESQTKEPKWSPRRKKETYLYECNQWYKNQAKWSAAHQFAKENNFEFHVFTEKDIRNRRK